MFTWQKAGTLIYGRNGHSAIYDGEKFLIIGGRRDHLNDVPVNNEVCTLNDSKMTCVEQSTALQKYFWTGLFLVDPNFGSDLKKC